MNTKTFVYWTAAMTFALVAAYFIIQWLKTPHLIAQSFCRREIGFHTKEADA